MGRLSDRRRCMGKNKPYYSEVEYIEVSEASGGKPYIVTDYVPFGAVSYDITFMILGYGSDAYYSKIMSALYGTDSIVTFYLLDQHNRYTNEIRLFCGSRDGSQKYLNISVNTFYRLQTDGLNRKYIFNGESGSLPALSEVINTAKLTFFTNQNKWCPKFSPSHLCSHLFL